MLRAIFILIILLVPNWLLADGREDRIKQRERENGREPFSVIAEQLRPITDPRSNGNFGRIIWQGGDSAEIYTVTPAARIYSKREEPNCGALLSLKISLTPTEYLHYRALWGHGRFFLIPAVESKVYQTELPSLLNCSSGTRCQYSKSEALELHDIAISSQQNFRYLVAGEKLRIQSDTSTTFTTGELVSGWGDYSGRIYRITVLVDSKVSPQLKDPSERFYVSRFNNPPASACRYWESLKG